MKYKNIIVFVALFTFIGALSSYGLTTKAEDNNKTDDETNVSAQKQSEVNFETEKKQMEINREAEKKALEGASESVKKEAEVKWEAEKKAFETSRENYKNGTSTKERDYDDDSATTTKEKDDDKWDDDASGHRSAVSVYVHNLLGIASTTRDKGLGEKVRIVAREQNDDKDKTSQAINDVKSRNAFITFLIGADFKNLGELRSSIVTTDNHISRLTDIKSKASSTPEIQLALDVEIKALTTEKERLSSIVSKNEKRASIFGWLVRLFQK